MLKLFYPDEYAEDVFSIDYEKLYEMGYRAVIFDLDNTLVPHGAPSTPEVDGLFSLIQQTGLKTLILSDNGETRMSLFLENISTPYICNAGKPKTANYKKALKALEVKKDEAIYIGDQLFTDILGANLSGIDCILVKYIGYYDEGYKGKRRALEAKLLNMYKKCKRYNRLGIEKRGRELDFREV